MEELKWLLLLCGVFSLVMAVMGKGPTWSIVIDLVLAGANCVGFVMLNPMLTEIEDHGLVLFCKVTCMITVAFYCFVFSAWLGRKRAPT